MLIPEWMSWKFFINSSQNCTFEHLFHFKHCNYHPYIMSCFAKYSQSLFDIKIMSFLFLLRILGYYLVILEWTLNGI